MTQVRYATADVDGYVIFYREAGDRSRPTLLLLHGFPSSGHMYRDLITLLSDRFHLVAPDLPGFGLSEIKPREAFDYSFDNLAKVIGRFTEVIELDRFALYVFDYGADRVPPRHGPSRARDRHCLAERQRLRGGAE